MRLKSLTNRLLSVILVLAICSIAFFGCAVSAATATLNYEVGNFCYDADTKTAITTMTFNGDPGFVSGRVQITCQNFSVSSVDVVDYTMYGDIAASAPEIAVKSKGFTVESSVYGDQDYIYTSITVKVALITTGTVDSVLEVLVAPEFAMGADGNGDILDSTNKTTTLSEKVTFDPDHEENETIVEPGEDTFGVEKWVCPDCGNEEHIQVIPEDAANRTFDEEIKIDAVNIYHDPLNGKITLNAHFDVEGYTEYDIIACPVDGNKSAIEGELGDSFAAGGELPAGSKMYSYLNVPARELAEDTLFTIVAKDTNGNLVYGPTMALNAADYCNYVIESDPTSKYAAVYAALLDYGIAANAYVNIGNEEIVKTYDVVPDLYKPAEFSVSLADDVTHAKDTAGASIYGTSINVKANAHIVFHFTFTEEYANDENLTIEFTKGGDTKSFAIGDLIHEEGAQKNYAYRYMLGSKEMSTPITVTIKSGETVLSYGTYSVEGYAVKAAAAAESNPSLESLAAVSKALVYYSKLLADCFV